VKKNVTFLLSLFSIALAGLASADSARRSLSTADLDSVQAVSDVRITRDGTTVAYSVASVNAADDSREWAIWVTELESGVSSKISAGHAGAYSPRWRPNTTHLAFLSAGLESASGDQLWLYDPETRRLEQLSDVDGGISDYAWAPDGERVVLVVENGAAVSGPGDPAKPIVITRFHFKQDGVGYLGSAQSDLQILDLDSGNVTSLTSSPYDEILPAWSPDGSRIAFVTKRGDDPDRHDNWDVYAIDPEAKADAVRLTHTTYAESNPDGWGGRPVWNSDSSRLVYTLDREPSLSYYALSELGTVSASGDTDRMITAKLDRNTMSPQWSADGETVYFLLEDEMIVYLATIPADGGTVTRLTDGAQTIRSFDVSETGQVAVIFGTTEQPDEVGRLSGGHIQKLSHQNDAWLDQLSLGETEVIDFSSADGTRIRGLLLKPPDYEQGKQYPTILRIHGGPVGQFRRAFNFEWQLLAANGYVVVGVNPRGSSGRGEAFQRAIFGDYGHGDVPDVLAAIDYLVDKGIADKDRLGIGGWSYGSMLTNYTIASDTRFKAATSGAGVSNMLALYGSDEWIRHWELELGSPWENTAAWLRLSYPFLHANRISTPTLFLCGEKDINVPLVNSEQMYQALRKIGVDAELIIYPNEYHQISRPSFRRDRLQRYVDWYDKYLQ